MALSSKTERALMKHDELELLTRTHHPTILELEDGALSDAQQRGNDALELIGDLLELTLLEEERLVPTIAPLDSSAVLDAVVEAWRVRAERRGASLSVQEADRVEIHADEHLLQRVFANLIGNALRHAGKGVHIRLAARRSGDGEGVHFTVADDVVGIPPAYHDLIFRKFGREIYFRANAQTCEKLYRLDSLQIGPLSDVLKADYAAGAQAEASYNGNRVLQVKDVGLNKLVVKLQNRTAASVPFKLQVLEKATLMRAVLQPDPDGRSEDLLIVDLGRKAAAAE